MAAGVAAVKVTTVWSPPAKFARPALFWAGPSRRLLTKHSSPSTRFARSKRTNPILHLDQLQPFNRRSHAAASCFCQTERWGKAFVWQSPSVSVGARTPRNPAITPATQTKMWRLRSKIMHSLNRKCATVPERLEPLRRNTCPPAGLFSSFGSYRNGSQIQRSIHATLNADLWSAKSPRNLRLVAA